MNSNDTLSCDGCTLVFDSKESLLEHKTRHDNFSCFECRKCNHRCHKEWMLQKHMLVHWRQEFRPMTCVVLGCPDRFAKLSDLEKHISVCHWVKTTKQRVRCKDCNVRYEPGMALLSHYYWRHQGGKTDSVPIDLSNTMDLHQSMVREFMRRFVSPAQKEFILAQMAENLRSWMARKVVDSSDSCSSSSGVSSE